MDEASYLAYRSVVESPVLRSIWAEVYGDRFWADVDTPWTLATVDDVHFVTARLSPQKTSRLVDLGCGSGALGRRWARDVGAKVEGFDANPNAIRLAQERSSDPSISTQVAFRIADIGAIPIPDATFDGAASLDVLMYVPDKANVLREVTRILRPGARFAGTVFELRTASVALALPAFVDYPGAFSAAGFIIETYEEAEAWRQLLEGVTARILERELEISREIHPPALKRVLTWARTRPPELPNSRRVRFCVHKP